MGGQYSRNTNHSRATNADEAIFQTHFFENLRDAQKKVVLDLIHTILAEVPKALKDNRIQFGVIFPSVIKVGESTYFNFRDALGDSRYYIGLNSINGDELPANKNEGLLCEISQILKTYTDKPFVISANLGSLGYLDYKGDDLKNMIYGPLVMYLGKYRYDAIGVNVSFVQTPA